MKLDMNIKRITVLSVLLSVIGAVYADVGPNPIVVKGIYTIDSCKIQMKRETVYADIYNDSAKVECTFELVNLGNSTTIQIGFPEMNFQYWSIGDYSENDKTNFNIYVDKTLLTENEIVVPAELDSVYRAYMHIFEIEKEYKRKMDSIYTANRVTKKNDGTYKYPSTYLYQSTIAALDELYEWRENKARFDSGLIDEFNIQMKKGDFPWYVWNVHFETNEQKTIKVEYSLPAGKGYGSDYRYFKYLLETGAGWYGLIEQAEIELKLHEIKQKTLEEILPRGYQMDPIGNIVKWNLTNLEPTNGDNIYLRYYNPSERREWENYQRKQKRKSM